MNRTTTYKWTEWCTSAYFMIMFLVFPLYFQNNYINMLEAKTALFVPVTCAYLVIGTVSILLVRLSTEKQKFLLQDIFFAVFVLAVVISTLLSEDMRNAWHAPECKMFGTMIILLCCGVYCLASRGVVFNKAVKLCLLLGMTAVFILAVINRFGMDPLDMYSNLIASQRGIYLSTIGNVNILSNFICIFVPVFAGLFMFAENRAQRIAYGLLVYLSVMAGISANSDSFFLGAGAAFIFLLWFAFDNKERLIAFVGMCIIGAASIFSMQIMERISRHDCGWGSLQESLLRMPWIIILVILAVFLVILLKKETGDDFSKLRKVVFILIGAAALACIVIIIRVNVSGSDSYFTFSDEWGTNRGFVWTRTCQLFSELPFYQQMIGIGPGAFRDFFAVFNMERAAAGLSDFADPHSEYLYFLVSTGVIGMVGYFGMILSAVVNCVKTRNCAALILAAVFISYMAQATVNNPLVFTTPYLFMFLGMSRCLTK